MKKIVLGIYTSLCALTLLGQSIREEQLNYYNSLGHADANWYEENIVAKEMPSTKMAGCNLNKTVYGWHPYWVGSAYNNYDWNLLSHFSFFSYEVNASTGNANSTHGWSTSAAVDAALASGNTKVTLTATLFSGHSTFFGSPTAQQTLITNLIDLVQSRGAHGVNIDFEGLPSSQKTNFSNFMVDLANQMHTAIPGSEISTVLYAVDWNNVFDFAAMEPAVDQYIVMGYAYYYQGSGTAGPCDPLFHFGSTYNYTLSKTTTNYIKAGCPPEKFILGLPYYGYEWSTTSQTIPSSTTANGVARTFNYVKNNTSGNYSTGNHQYDWDSYTDIYTFNNGTTDRQCFITLEDGFRKRLQFTNNTGIGGIGIWALGYDDGYNQLWNGINDYLTDCYVAPCIDTIHDFGGPHKNYYNNEDYTWTIAPSGAMSIDVTFHEFDVENNYDYLYIYDGPTTSSAQISGSPFTGTTLPSNFSSSGNSLTFRFTSDGATVAPGFVATYQCVTDNIPPTTSVSTTGNWKTTDFTATFADNDDLALQENFYQVADFNGLEWRANDTHGFFNDEFSQASIHSDWTSSLGTWSIVSGALEQTNEAISNTNLYASVTQTSTESYLYHWKGEINGTGTNRRAGIHFFCDDASLSNRGNSYFVYYRVDSDKCQIYKVVNDTWTLETDDAVTISPNTSYDFKIYFDPSTGNIKAFLDNQLVSEWTDPSPHSSGNSISLRAGNCNAVYDDFKVYKSRSASENITVGSALAMMRYQNTTPTTPAGKITSINIDANENWSTENVKTENIDWTEPVTISSIYDGIGTDIDTTNIGTELSLNWNGTTDPHSDVMEYWYTIGTTIGGTDIVNWTSNGAATSVTHTGLSLIPGTIYYGSVIAENGANLQTIAIDSDGQRYVIPTNAPVAAFTTSTTTICSGEVMQLSNTSTDATSYLWASTGGTLSSTTATNPTVAFTATGSYTIDLTATGPGGTNTTSQTISVTVVQAPVAAGTPSATAVTLPAASVSFTNSSSNASSYIWNFGDGNSSTNTNPTYSFSTAGTYAVELIASNGACPSSTTTFTITVEPAAPLPTANFTFSGTSICLGNSISLTNTSTDATSYVWSTTGGTLSSTTAFEPSISFTTSGTYSVSLTAIGAGGTNSTSNNISVNVVTPPTADAMPNVDTVYLPNGIISFSNLSSDADSFFWDFGDGNTSSDVNPWNDYLTAGSYTVELIASNSYCAEDTFSLPVVVLESVSIIELGLNTIISTYPNPVDDQFSLSITAEKELLFQISLLTVEGKIIHNFPNLVTEKGSNISALDLTSFNLAKGAYLLKLQTENTVHTIQLIKE